MRYQFIDDNQESALGTLGRGALRTAARAGEAIVGAPGDIASGVIGLGNLASKAITGSEIPGASKLQEFIPGSETVRKHITEPLTGDYLKPQGAIEEALDTIVGDVASLIAPGGLATAGSRAALKGIGKLGLKEGAKLVGKTALKAGAAHGAGVLAENLTDSPLIGAGVKTGTLLGLSLYSGTKGGREKLKDIEKNAYEQAERSVKEGDTIKAYDLKQRLDNGLQLLKNSDTPDKDFITKRLEAVKSQIKQGKLETKTAIELRKNMNDWLYKQDISPEAKRYVGRTRDLLNKSLDQYGKENKVFAKAFDKADDIHRGMAAAGTVQQFLNKNASVKNFLNHWKPLTHTGAGLLHFFGRPLTAGAFATLPAAVTAKYIGQTWNLIANSPEAAKYYKKAAKAALANDATTFARSIKAFDKVASKEIGNNQSNSRARFELVA